MQQYTLSECWTMLDVDPQTFRTWLKQAQIEPQTSKNDKRIKYVTEDQLMQLADEHGRVLDQAVKPIEPIIPANTYKLLVERVGVAEKSLGDAIRKQAEDHQQLAISLLQEIEEAQQRDLRLLEKRLREQFTASIEEVRKPLQEHQQKLDEHLQRLAETTERQDTATSTLREELHQLAATQGAALSTLREEITTLLQQTIETSIETSQQETKALIATFERETRDNLQALDTGVTRDLAAITEQLKPLAIKLETTAAIAFTLQSQLEHQGQMIERLIAQLQEEKEAHVDLAQQIAELKKAQSIRPKQTRVKRGLGQSTS